MKTNLINLEQFFASQNIQGELMCSYHWSALGIITGFMHKENEIFLYVIKDDEIKKMQTIEWNGTLKDFSKKNRGLSLPGLIINESAIPNNDTYIENFIEGYCEMYQNLISFTTEEHVHNFINKKVEAEKFSPAIGMLFQNGLLEMIKMKAEPDSSDEKKAGEVSEDGSDSLDASLEDSFDDFDGGDLSGDLFRYVPECVKTAELCLAAVRQSGDALEHVPENLKTEELCLATVKQNGYALQNVPECLKQRNCALRRLNKPVFPLSMSPKT